MASPQLDPEDWAGGEAGESPATRVNAVVKLSINNPATKTNAFFKVYSFLISVFRFPIFLFITKRKMQSPTRATISVKVCQSKT